MITVFFKTIRRNFSLILCFALLSSFSSALRAADPGISIVPIDPELEQYLIERDTFYKLDAFRAWVELPKLKDIITAKQKVDVYEGYIGELEAYGLVPQEEMDCLLTLAPVTDTKAQDIPLRAARKKLEHSDPCFPKFGRRSVDRPAAWQMDELLRGDAKPKPKPTELDHTGGATPPPKSSDDGGTGGRGGSTGGGTGRTNGE